jgi:ERCC4-type nuclease
MVSLLIDNRENIKDLLIENIPDAQLKNLEIGDYVFTINEKPFLIIERKTVTDYAASIVDARGREQKKRLIANKDNANIMYLVEGDLKKDNQSFKYNKVDRHTIISSIINTMYRDKLQVFHTANVMETIFFIESINRKLIKQGNSFLENKTSYETDLINTVKSTKKKNMTPEITFQMILNCIPGISNKVSKRIASKFTTPKNMITELLSIENKNDRLECIKNIKMSDDEKAKKISKTVAENIIVYLGLNNEDTGAIDK